MSAKKKPVNLIYIGRDFYPKSNTMMSSIYVEGTWERYDWGFVNIALEGGRSIDIRQATKAEIKIANAMLAAYKRKIAKCNR